MRIGVGEMGKIWGQDGRWYGEGLRINLLFAGLLPLGFRCTSVVSGAFPRPAGLSVHVSAKVLLKTPTLEAREIAVIYRP